MQWTRAHYPAAPYKEKNMFRKCKDCGWFIPMSKVATITQGICDCPLPIYLDIDDNYYVDGEEDATFCGTFKKKED